MKALLTGGGGFVGRHLAKCLLDREWEVILFDDFSRFSRKEIAELSHRAEIIEGDINEIQKLSPVTDSVEVVFHLAAKSRTSESHTDREGCFRTNVNGTFSLLEACKDAKPKVVFPSSWVVYDKNSIADGKATVESAKLRANSPYAISKLVGEEYVRFYSEQYGFDHVILRLSNVYGAGDNNRIIPNTVDKALRNELITIFGNHHYVNFVHVRDVVKAMYRVAEDANANNETMNIGDRESVNLSDMAQRIVTESKSASKIKIAPLDPSEYPYYRPDLDFARKISGYAPSVSFDEGIAEVVEWRKSLLRNRDQLVVSSHQ
jgi:UDP-glucose 4-epimerase